MPDIPQPLGTIAAICPHCHKIAMALPYHNADDVYIHKDSFVEYLLLGYALLPASDEVNIENMQMWYQCRCEHVYSVEGYKEAQEEMDKMAQEFEQNLEEININKLFNPDGFDDSDEN